MGNFQKGGRGGKNFGGKSEFKRGGFGNNRQQTMHKAKCDECGNVAEVPFRPTGDKPIYCNDCFGSQKNEGFRKSNFDSRFENREPFGMKKNPTTGTFGHKKSNNQKSNQHSEQVFSKADMEKVVGELHVKIDTLTKLVENFTETQLKKVAVVADTVSKKIENKTKEAKKEVSAIIKKVETKSKPATAKKVATKAVPLAKKIVKKTVKKVVKKAIKKK